MENNGLSIWPWIESTIRMSTPLIFAAMGGLMSERSGVIQIGLEGLMLLGGFAAAVVGLKFGGGIGFLAGGLAGALGAALYATLVLRARANQIVAGTGMNLLAAGLTPLLCKAFYDTTTATPALEMGERLSVSPYFVMTLVLAFVTVWFHRLRSGLWVKFAGEHPQALATAGVSVVATRFWSVVTGGFFAGLGGAVLSIGLASSFARNMTAGRGFIALAALILGRWKPLPAAAACLLFGFLDVVQLRLQGVVLWGTEPVPVQLVNVIPYLVTLLVLAGFVGGSRAPKSLGIPWESR